MKRKPGGRGKRGWLRRAAVAAGVILASFYLAALLGLVALRWVDPWFTMVHVQRRVEAWLDRAKYEKRYRFVPLREISPHLPHAVVAAEDAKFYRHWGFDPGEIKDAILDDLPRGRLRGASTITQQLIKNLYFATGGSVVRKGLEASLVLPAEWILGKDRILELYLNVIEWGPGVFGAEAAAQYHYRMPAARIDRERAARLAAVLPNPLRRRPDRMTHYSETILRRMAQMGW
jgi:monofunctional biosynthetic peptidoglycan transglycosylase